MGVEHLGKPYTIRRLSYSAVSKYMECPRQFYLSRVGGLDKSTWYATLMGSVVHHITEQHDLKVAGFDYARGETTPKAFPKLFRKLVRETEAKDIEVKASGKETKGVVSWYGSPAKKDRKWCEVFGPIIIQRWIDWTAENGMVVATMPDGKPGIEVACNAPVGGAQFLGYVDRVFDMGDGTFAVVDLKTGAIPNDEMQLAVYAYQLRHLYNWQVGMAAYWGQFSGSKPDEIVFDVKNWYEVPDSRDKILDSQILGAAQGMEAGVFYGNTSSRFCSSCSLRDYCSVVGGKVSHMIPEPAPIKVLRAGELAGAGTRKVGVDVTVGPVISEERNE